MSLDPYAIECQRCRRSFPSRYWFAAPGVCTECFQALSAEEQALLAPPPPGVQYAGFWRRFASLWVDTIVLLPIGLLETWLAGERRDLAVALLAPNFLVGWAYTVGLHARWGQTAGKMVVVIRVLSTDASPIGLRQAFLRSSVDIGLGLVIAVVHGWALLQIPEAQYAVMDGAARQARLYELIGEWWALPWLLMAWYWSEVVTMLFNRRRRAPHDFLAGTIVVRLARAGGRAPAPQPQQAESGNSQ
jgi:uncharacterized RDD family membrane protein YckC